MIIVTATIGIECVNDYNKYEVIDEYRTRNVTCQETQGIYSYNHYQCRFIYFIGIVIICTKYAESKK